MTVYTNADDIMNAVAKKQKEIDALLKQKESIMTLTDDQRLAIVYHDCTCTWNHTDGCSWFYEFKNGIDDWKGSAHSRALEQIQALRSACLTGILKGTPEQIVSGIKYLKGK